MEPAVLSSDYPCRKDAPEDKDPPEGNGHVYRRLYHRHRDQLPAVTLMYPVC